MKEKLPLSKLFLNSIFGYMQKYKLLAKTLSAPYSFSALRSPVPPLHLFPLTLFLKNSTASAFSLIQF